VRRRDGEVVVRACPRGPLLVRGAEVVLDAHGTEHAVDRPVVALCVCDRSARQPWCDGTHKSLQPREDA